MIKKYRAGGARVCLALGLVFLGPLLVSCQKKPGPERPTPSGPLSVAPTATAPTTLPAPPPNATGAAPQAASSQVAAATSQPALPQGGLNLPPRNPAAPPPAASLRAFGLGIERNIPAEDYDIGPLEETRSATGDRADIIRVIDRFVAGLAAGNLDKELFDPAARAALALLLAPPGPASPDSPASKPEAYRIGALKVEGDVASLRIGIPSLSDGKRDAARVNLLHTEGHWYIESYAPEMTTASSSASGDGFDPDALRRQS
ncbi:MAG TPA: hypothetical protein VMC79_07675 [Rectinemataceae bacterium]|nr:hypothetical protein [Rectinemataceae bacterium]